MISHMRKFRSRWTPGLVGSGAHLMISRTQFSSAIVIVGLFLRLMTERLLRCQKNSSHKNLYRKKKTKHLFGSSFPGMRNTFLRSFPAELSSHSSDWLMLGHMPTSELITDKGKLPINLSWAHSMPVGHVCDCGLGGVESRKKSGFCQKKEIGVQVTTSILLNWALAIIL